MRRVVEEINNRYLTCEAQDPYHLIIYLKMQIRICRNTILVDHSSHFAVNLLWPRMLFTISHHVTNLWSMKLKRSNLVAIVSYKLLRKIIFSTEKLVVLIIAQFDRTLLEDKIYQVTIITGKMKRGLCKIRQTQIDRIFHFTFNLQHSSATHSLSAEQVCR